MKIEGNIRKMKGTNGDHVSYALPLFDNLNPNHQLAMNDLIGKEIAISFQHEINCVVTGKKIKKTYGEGMSYDAFMQSPLAVESIIRPELSQIHLGIALRDEAWEREHHLQPHTVYLSFTGDVKVGVTRDTQIPSRWIDQGAIAAISIAHTPYRQAAGLLEVALKNHFADKTNWRKMLTDVDFNADLVAQKHQAISFLSDDLAQYGIENNEITFLKYPILAYPTKIKSIKLDTSPVIQGKLNGIKGQYLIFENGDVFNVRAHTAYKIALEF